MKRALIFSLACAFLSAAPAVQAEELVIKAAAVYTGTGSFLAPGMVHVKNGKIAAVGKDIAVPAGVKVLDLGNGVLMPGLIDAHTTLAVEGGAAESTLEVTPGIRIGESVDWNGRAMRHLRAEGVTTVSIVPGTENVIAGLSCVGKTAGRELLRTDHALVVTLASDPGNGNSARNRPDSIYNRQPTNRMGVVWILRQEFARSRDGKGDRLVTEAVLGKRPVVCVSRSDSDILAALRLRQDHPINLAIAGGHEAHKVRAELAKAKVPVLLASSGTTSGPEQTEPILNLAGALNDAGVPAALTGGRLLEQMRFAVRFGMPKEAALAAVTVTPAKWLGVDSRVGTIAVGRDADLVALSGDPFELTSTIRWTMIDGVLRAEEP